MKASALQIESSCWMPEARNLIYGYIPYPVSPFKFLACPIGNCYRHFSQRLLIYLSFFVCLIACPFAILLLGGKTAFLFRQLSVVCTLSLYMGFIFSLTHILVDIAAHQFRLKRMDYGSRNIGCQWIVLYSGLILGFCLHHMMFPRLILLLGEGSVIDLPFVLWIIPLMGASIYCNLIIILLSQKSQKEQRSESLPKSKAPQQKLDFKQNQAKQIRFKQNRRSVDINSQKISHVKSEDHYCRIFYWNDESLKEILIRNSLKKLHIQLGLNDFLQIHKSYLINKSQGFEYCKKRRHHCLKLKSCRDPLPISRRRQTEVKKALSI